MVQAAAFMSVNLSWGKIRNEKIQKENILEEFRLFKFERSKLAKKEKNRKVTRK